MRYRFISLFLCIGMILAGCSPEDFVNVANETADFEGMNETPDLSYEVPVVVPHILIDQVGYTPEGKKTVIFRGEELPDSFEVVDARNGTVVYEGQIKEKERENSGKDLIGYGDFTELVTEGTYYIQSSVFGRSYDFDIAGNVYDDVFAHGVNHLEEVQNKKINVTLPKGQSEQAEIIIQGGWLTDEAGNQDLKLASEVMLTVLAAYELYPDSFFINEADGGAGNPPEILTYLKQQTEWMQQLQDEKSGGVYGGVVADNKGTITTYSMADMDEEAAACFTAALAKFSYVYKKYDQQYAAGCLKAADRAWNYINKQQWTEQENRKEAPKEIMFCAATEMYRASGWNSYHLYTRQLLEEGMEIVDSSWATYGAVTYLTTKHYVDKKHCETVMKQLMSGAEEISAKARVSAYQTEGDSEFTNIKELLWNMVILSIADYVITNHEYATVIENHQHYFFGCNPKAMCLVHEDGCDSMSDGEKNIQDDLQLNAYHIFMLSQILNVE